jgi:hypothetical protein
LTVIGAFTWSIHAGEVRNGATATSIIFSWRVRSDRLHQGQSCARFTRPAVSALRSTYRQVLTSEAASAMAIAR